MKVCKECGREFKPKCSSNPNIYCSHRCLYAKLSKRYAGTI